MSAAVLLANHRRTPVIERGRAPPAPRRSMTSRFDQDVRDFHDAVTAGDAPGAARLLQHPHVRARVNDALFAFGQRAAHVAAKNEVLLRVLIAAGANVNLLSAWENGPYTVLDNADEGTAHFLIAQGARLTPNVAARLGWFDDLRAIVAADPTSVHARGGDGQQPLHEAATPAVADFLLDQGADPEARCIDHRSTPAQYALVARPAVCRRLLERGASPDIYMAAHLGDTALATRVLDADPGCVQARIHEPGYDPVPPLHIYCWTIGFGLSPHDVARLQGHRAVLDLLHARSPARVRFFSAIGAADEAGAQGALAEDPALLTSMTADEHGYLARAIFHEHDEAVELMLRFGFDPAAPGIDGGTALHAACWVGQARLVERLLEFGRVPVDARDPTHGSTPLGWAAFGSVHRRARGADYAAVAGLLVAAGASVTGAGNRNGMTLLQMAAGNPAMQDALRRLGAR